ncbi:MAG: DUF4982 domain-containing protein, partial [Lacunisphaera sp.]|nr:DUF4982 domain-containing protein [Lacunisphaera sp.]
SDASSCTVMPAPCGTGLKLQVNVYTRCSRVRLELNGQIIGEQDIVPKPLRIPRFAMTMTPIVQATELTAQFEVPYEAGELKAIGYLEGKEVVSKVLVSAGKPKQIILTPDRATIRANRGDLSFVTVEIADEKGRLIPNAALPVNFTISGEGELAAAGNARPDQPVSFQKTECLTFRGKALVILRASTKAGTITLKAESEGIEAAVVQIMTAADLETRKP